MRNRKGAAIELETLSWWLIALGVLVVIVIGFFYLRKSGLGGVEFIKNLFRFGK